MNTTEANTERFARLLGVELKVALQLHLTPEPESFDNPDVSALLARARQEGLTYECDGKAQVFVRADMEEDYTKLEEYVAREQVRVLFPGDTLHIAERSKFVFRRKVKQIPLGRGGRGARTKVGTWMRIARFGGEEKGQCIECFSAPGASEPQKEYFSPIFTAPFIEDPNSFRPVFLKALISSEYRYFRIDAGMRGSDILVTLAREREENVPLYLQLEKKPSSR